MTIAGKIESTIAIPSGVTVSFDGNVMKVNGPRGELSRNFAHPGIDIAVGEGEVSVSCEYPRIKDKIVFSHFPMKVTVKGDRVEINNYMGGHAPRYANIMKGCTVKVNGQDVTVEGNDIEACGQTAANLERATSRLGFDKRTFQDGIYIVQKSHKVKE